MNAANPSCSVSRTGRRKSERKSHQKGSNPAKGPSSRNKLTERQISLQLQEQACTDGIFRNKDQEFLNQIPPRFFTLSRCQTTKERRSKKAAEWQLGRSSSVSVSVVRGPSSHQNVRSEFATTASSNAPMATRGQNVSVLHLRGPPEPWEAVVAGSLRSARMESAGQRDLSPVGWRGGSSDAGVFLGRSGWVQVQQRSLDEHRATNHHVPQIPQHNVGDMRVRLVDWHSASEPTHRRPDTLSLRRGDKAKPEKVTPSPLNLSYGSFSPPPITPIISPPPAFQDMKPVRQKPPLLSRSIVTVDATSPPQSPGPRYRLRTPSPKSPPRIAKQQSSNSFLGRRNLNISRSSSEDEDCRKATAAPTRRRASPRARFSDSSSSSCAGEQDSWGGRVRRSRSLQLPEERTPPGHRPRRHLTKKTLSEESRGRGLRPEAIAEARVVAEFINKVRSRTAARELLTSRYLQRPETKSDWPAGGQTYNVCVVGDPFTERTAKPQYNASVVNGRSLRDSRGGCGTPCNPSTCDFWPHCSHRGSCEMDAKSRMKFENVDIDGYVSIRRSGNQQRVESPRSRSPHVTASPQNRSPHPSASPQDPIRTSRSPVRDNSVPQQSEHWRLTPGDARRSGASTPVSNSRCSPASDRSRGDTSSNGKKSANQPSNSPTPSWDQLRSLSLPKSFLSHRDEEKPAKARKQLDSPKISERTSRTAPVTPVRELNIADQADALAKQNYCHSVSAPVLEIPQEEVLRPSALELTSHEKTILPEKSSQETMVDKLRKSISQRFHKNKENRRGMSLRESNFDNDRGKKDAIDKDLVKNRDVVSERNSPLESPLDAQAYNKIRFGPLLWRTSKERRRGRDLGRGGPCRSADSGIHVERSMAAESSDSRDTDPHEDPDSPQMRSGRQVQRANSELGGLGGQRLLGWETRRRPRFHRKVGPCGSFTNGVDDDEAPAPLRRSTSQPLGLDEISPLRKTRASSEDDRGTSEDEALFGSESSLLSLNSGKAPELIEDAAIAEALWDHVAMDARELGFRAGDLIQVHNTADKDWWWGATEGRTGWFPSSFVRLRVSQEDTVEDCLAAMAAGSRAAAHLRRTSVSLLSNDQVRSCVVRELLSTERDFVRVLRDVVEGYIEECRRRTDMFTPQQIHAIFGNIEELLEFQTKFLGELEERVDEQAPYRSCVGDVFLRHQGGFRQYSEYCNSHPTATATLQQLYQDPTYNAFFEGCRIMRGLIEIPLDGYLLTPVQRICKYPLQLGELLKYTRPDHEDHVPVKEALSVMRGVAVLVNERKRRMESLEKIATWQARVEGWEGQDLLEQSSQLLHQDEVIRVTSGMWTSHISLFLFDHQVVYCKKDLLKRHLLVYKGRMCLDTSEVVDVPDGKDPILGATVRNAVKIHSLLQDKWLLFCCRSSQSKARWLAALAAERRLVLTDRQEGLELTPAARHLARAQAQIRAEKSKLKRDGSFGELPSRKAWFTWGGRKQQSVT